jgi:hypothetical protein
MLEASAKDWMGAGRARVLTVRCDGCTGDVRLDVVRTKIAAAASSMMTQEKDDQRLQRVRVLIACSSFQVRSPMDAFKLMQSFGSRTPSRNSHHSHS